MNENQTSVTLTVAEAAALLDVSPDAIYDAVKRGELSAVRVGRRICIARKPLAAALGLEEHSCDS